MVNFSGLGVPELTRNEEPMPDEGDPMALYSVRAAWEVTGAGGAETGAARAATGVEGTVTGAAGAGAMTVGKDVPLAVNVVLARRVLEPLP